MDKVVELFYKKLKKEKIPTLAVGRITNKKGVTRFLEVILERKYRYTFPDSVKKVPKKYRGFKVKVF